MSSRRTECLRLHDVLRGVVVSVVSVSFVVGVVVSVVVVGVVVVGVVVVGVVVAVSVHRGRGSQAPASRHMVQPLANPRSLRWVRGLLPGDEGTAWLAEVGSCLAETTDKGERRRYLRSYRHKVPQLIWTSWTEHLSASRQRELL